MSKVKVLKNGGLRIILHPAEASNLRSLLGAQVPKRLESIALYGLYAKIDTKLEKHQAGSFNWTAHDRVLG